MAYSLISSSFWDFPVALFLAVFAEFIAWLNVALYSNANPSALSLSLFVFHSSPPVPLCASSMKTRLSSPKLSTATVVSFSSSFSLWISIISILFPQKRFLPSLLNISASSFLTDIYYMPEE